MARIVLLGDRAVNNKVFPIREPYYYLSDVDFFSLLPSEEGHFTPRENVRELAAVFKLLTQRLIEKRCHESELAREIYKKYRDAKE